MDVNRSEVKVNYSPAGVAEAPPNAEAVKMKAGMELVDNVAKQQLEQTQQVQQKNENGAQKEQVAEQPVENRRDEASLSRESVIYHLTPEEVAQLEKLWTLEKMGELWEAFIKWFPSPDKSLEENLRQLAKLFQALQQAVLANTTGEEQRIQLERLDRALSQSLNRQWDSNMKELISFFNRFGMTDSLEVLKKNLYRLVTGQQLSGSDMERFWQQGKRTETPLYDAPMRGNPPVASKAQTGNFRQPGDFNQAGNFRQTGIIYQAEAGGKVSANQQFNQQIKNNPGSERVFVERSASSFTQQYSGERGKISSPSSKLYTGGDIEKLTQFTKYMNTGGNVFENKKITGKSEELVGVLASVTSMKAQVFGKEAKMTGPMKSTMREAVDKMIDYYVLQNKKDIERQRSAVAQDDVSIYKVYHQTMSAYQETNEPGSAISQGILYALELFNRKKADEAFQKAPRYAELAGFFSLNGRNAALLEEGERRGRLALEEDWIAFSKKLALLLEPESYKIFGMSKKAAALVGAVGAGIIMAISFFFFN